MKLTPLFILLLALSFANAAENKKGMNRRGFLRGFIAGTSVVIANPMGVLAGSSQQLGAVLPEALKRHLVKIRLRMISVVGSEADANPNPFLGLQRYIKFLEEIASQTDEIEIKLKILKRAEIAKRELAIFQNVYLEKSAEYLKSKGIDTSESSNANKNLELDKKLEELGDIERSDFIDKLDSLPLDLRIITIRTMLASDLMKRMAWQVHFTTHEEESKILILSREDINYLLEYYRYLNETAVYLENERLLLKSKGMDFGSTSTLSEQLLGQYIEEARLSILAYYKSKKNIKPLNLSEKSCKAFLQL